MIPFLLKATLIVTVFWTYPAPLLAMTFDDDDRTRPNIVLFLADDMGCGEVQCLNRQRGKIATPNLDAMARNGMVFTDAHSGSSVCTPTRYGLLTGRYAWRSRLQKGVVTGGKSLIGKNQLTIAKMLRTSGYHTAMYGKWHLGMLFDNKVNPRKKVAIGSRVSHGPLDRGGFDKFSGFHHSRQMDIWIDDDTVSEHIRPAEVLPRLTREAVNYIKSRNDHPEPFFLYVPWNSPHSPVVPSSEWQGKSGLNQHADFVMQTDHSIGQVIKALKEYGFEKNTLVIFSSDNGTSAGTAKMDQLQSLGHYPSGVFRGAKSDAWDGGHRVPFIVQWPRVVKSGTTCNDLICLTDIMATVADITKDDSSKSKLPDSISFLRLLRQQDGERRVDVIHHSVNGRFAIRRGRWKLILCAGSGGWSQPKDANAQANGRPKWQLYDMQDDAEESRNLYESQPEKARELLALLKSQIANGRSTPGSPLNNDTEIKLQ